MIWAILIVGFIIVAAFVAMAMMKGKEERAEQEAKEAEEREEQAAKFNIHLRDAEVGDFVEMKGIGPELIDVFFKIESLHTYEDEEGFLWGEAQGQCGSKPVFLEFIEDDEIEIFVKIGKMELSLNDIGVTEDDLARIDDDEEGTIEFNHDSFVYEDSGDVTFYRNGEGDGEPFYSWQFISQDGLRSLCFEKYGRKIEAGVCTKVDYAQVNLTRE